MIKKSLKVVLYLVFFGMILFVSIFTWRNASTGRTIILATTTSVNDSGLMDYLRPVFEKETGMKLKIVSQGTGQAIKTGEDGNADVLLLHAKEAEEEFIAKGFGVERIEIAYNYFVVVGPPDDPAMLRTGDYSASQALQKIAAEEMVFISRGDDSGTHKKEMSIWKKIGIEPSGHWYISAGKGMGAVLLMASEKQGYTLTDKATYLSMKENLDLEVVIGEAPELLNQYSIIQVNPEKHPGIIKKGADLFVHWITSEKALNMINEFGKDKYGESLFIVNYFAN